MQKKIGIIRNVEENGLMGEQYWAISSSDMFDSACERIRDYSDGLHSNCHISGQTQDVFIEKPNMFVAHETITFTIGGAVYY